LYNLIFMFYTADEKTKGSGLPWKTKRRLIISPCCICILPIIAR
jgi:hypothetical protein